jgi:hypothetical protein
MRRLVAAGVAVVALAICPALPANAEASASGTPVITPALAAAVVDDLWPRREAALMARNAATLGALETGAAEALDHAWIDGATTGLAAGELPRTITGRYVLVPRQLSYPASFIAVIVYQNAGSPNWVYTEVAAFARSGPADAWRLAVDACPPVPKDFRELVQDPQSDDFAPVVAPDLDLPFGDLPARSAHRWPGWSIDATPVTDVYGVGLANGAALACFGTT